MTPLETIEILRAHLTERYIVERELGRGGMAVVYLAHDRRHGRPVAIKVLNPELSSAVGGERFLREIRIAAQLTHPHIVTVFDSGEADGLLYYIMPFMPGESLRDRLVREKQLGLEDAIGITREVADALAYAHDHGVVHRDIKPENILLTGTHACVADFGIARAVTAETRLTVSGMSPGTPAYMSPEQGVADSGVDGRSDQYSLACVLYEMLAGEPPFTGPTVNAMLAKRMLQPAPSVRIVRDIVPEAIDLTIQRALARVPADRFATMREFAAALHTGATPVSMPRITPPDQRWPQLDAPVRALPTPSGEPAVAPAASRTRWLRTSRAFPYLVGALLVTIAGAAAAIVFAGGEEPVTNPDLIAILPFRAQSADTEVQELGQGIPDLLTDQLTRDAGPHTVDFGTVLGVWREVGLPGGDLSDALVERLAQSTGARQIVEGSIVGTRSSLTVKASLRDIESRSSRATAMATGPLDAYPALVDSVAAALLSKAAGEEEYVYHLKNYPLPALRAYLDGRKLYHLGRYTEAQRKYEEALEVDSTLTLAAMGLVVVSNNIRIVNESSERGLRLAWATRERLNGSDRAYLEAHAGSRYPAVNPQADQIQAWEHAVERTNRPEAHFELGERLFMYGRYVGIDDPWLRAERSFLQAVRLRRGFVAPLQRLIEIAAAREDTAALRSHMRELLTADSTAEVAGYIRWRASLALAASRGAPQTPPDLVGLPGTSLKLIWSVAQLEGHSRAIDDADRALRRLQDSAVTGDMQADAIGGQYVLAMNQGRVRAAPDLLRDAAGSREYLIPIVRAQLVRDALFGGGSPDTARAALVQLTRTIEDAPSDPTPLDAAALYVALCAVEQWNIAHQQTATARQSIARMRALVPILHRERIGGTSTPVVGAVPSCPALLEAELADTENNAVLLGDAVARADSVMTLGPMEADAMAGNLIVARLREKLGDSQGALRALRRRPRAVLGLFYLAPSLREEGRLAALTGDRAGAIRAYQHYLVLRSRPDPEIQLEVDSVRAALQRLEIVAANGRGTDRRDAPSRQPD